MSTPRLHSVIRSVRRRAMVRHALRAGIGAWAVLAASAGLAVAGLRLAGVTTPIDAPLLAGAVAGAGLLWALLTAWWRRWSPLRAAMEIDRSLGLKDRLGAAVELASSNDAFAPLLVREAERFAATVRPGQVVRMRDGVRVASIAWLVAGVAACALVFAWMPTLRWDRQRTAAREPAPETLAEARDIIREAAAAGAMPEAPPISPDDAVAELERELREGRLDEAGVRAKAASIADQAAHRLQARSEEAWKRAEEMRSMLARAAEEGVPSRETSDLTRALKRADAEAAAKAARELAQRLPRLSPEERLALEQELAAIEEQLASQAAIDNSRPDDAPRAGEEPVMPAGDEAAADSGATPEQPKPESAPPPPAPPRESKPPPPESTEAPREGPEAGEAPPNTEERTPGTPPNVEEQPSGNAQGVDEPSRDPNSARRPQREVSPESLREALRQARDQLHRESTPQNGGQGQPGERQQEQAPRDGQPRSEQQGMPPESAKPSGEPGRQSTPGQQQAPGEQRPAQGDQPRPTPGQERPDPRQSPSAQPSPQQGQRSEPQPGAGAPERRAQDGARQTPGSEQPPDVLQVEPGKPGEQSENMNVPPEGFERLAEELQRIAQDERRAKEMMREAQRFRDQAQRMLEQMTPQQRRELERLAREFAKQMQGQPPETPPLDEDVRRPAGEMTGERADEQPRRNDDATGEAPDAVREPGGAMRPEITRRDRPGRSEGPVGEDATARVPVRDRPLPEGTTPVDARARGVDERPIAELASRSQGDPNAPREALAPVLRQAAQSAERSIEQRAVPPQYADLVRRVFRRYVERGAQ